MAKKSTTVAPERRVFSRLQRRMPCEFVHEGRKLAGIVTDVSARGVFVETSHRIPSGTELRLLLRDPKGAFELLGRVKREKRSHRSVRPVLAGGFGVTLDVVPEPFFRLLIELGLG